MLLGSRKNEGLVKYEQKLKENYRNTIEQDNLNNMDFGDGENFEKDSRLNSSMNDLSKILVEKLKEFCGKKINKYTGGKIDNRNANEINDKSKKIEILKGFLNRK